MNECEKCRRLSAYVDGELGAAERAAMEHHLAQCPAGGAELRELRSATALLHGAAMPVLSAAGLVRLHGRVDEWRRRGAERFAGFLSAMAACLAIASALSLMRAGEAAPAPLPWETSTNRVADDSSAANSKETTVAEWMVADLSHGGSNGE